jgi:hypothetical protein
MNLRARCRSAATLSRWALPVLPLSCCLLLLAAAANADDNPIPLAKPEELGFSGERLERITAAMQRARARSFTSRQSARATSTPAQR